MSAPSPTNKPPRKADSASSKRSVQTTSSSSPRNDPLYAPSSPTIVHKMHGVAQTDASYPGTSGKFNPADELSSYNCKQYAQLCAFREHCRGVMTELGASVHDLLALKDIFLKMSEHLPEAPVCDLLLVSSKVYRRCGELSRCLSAMFSVTFADDFTDDDFKFTEARIMKRTIRKLEQQLASVTAERDDLKAKHDALSRAARGHRNVVDGLQDQNDSLSARNASLEDSMAVLFRQLARDFESFSEHQLADVQEDLTVQEALSSARSQFASSIDGVQNRLRFFQSTLADITNEAAGYDPSGSLRTRLKALDVHAAHLTNRFTAVRDGLLNTADELVTVIREKRKVLNFSLEHLRAYEAQNAQMRAGRQLMHDLRQQLIEAERVFSSTFAMGSLVKVERSGDIHISFAASDGAAAPASPSRGSNRFTAGNTRAISELIRGMNDLAHRVTVALQSDEEHKAVLRAVALAVPSARQGGGDGEGGDGAASPGAGRRDTTSGVADSSGLYTLSQRRSTVGALNAERRQSLLTGPDAAAGGGAGGGGGPGGGDMTTYLKLREDFSVKAGFLREVYEERIADLESRVEQLQKRLLITKREAEEDREALKRALEGIAAKGNADLTKLPVDDKAAAIRTKEAWLRHKAQTLANRKEAGHDALQALGEFELDGSPRRGYISPFAAFARIARTGRNAPTTGANNPTVGQAMYQYTVALPAGGGRGNTSSATLRTGYSRQQQEENAELIRKLKDLEREANAAAVMSATAGPDSDAPRTRGANQIVYTPQPPPASSSSAPASTTKKPSSVKPPSGPRGS